MLRKPKANDYCQRLLLSNMFQLATITTSPLQPTKPSYSLAFFNSQITQRGREGNLDEAKTIFNNMPFRNVISWTALLTAYSDNGDVFRAREVFDQMPKRNAASWNAMISAYARNPKFLFYAYELFSAMPNKNSVTYGTIITSFSRAGMLLQAEEVYKRMPPGWRDPIGSNALIYGYLRVGEINKADRIFRGMVFRDVFTWSSMIDGYCKYGKILVARETFEAMPVKNVVSWTAMLRGYLKLGDFKEGFWLFSQMRRENVTANSTTLSVLLDACSELDGSREGIQIHGLVIAMGFEQDIFLGNTVIVMYSRANCMDAARRMFDTMGRKDVVSWNSVISGYVEQDKTEEACTLFYAMPDKDVVSWTSMVVGFSKRGWTEEATSLFEMMPYKDDVGWTAIVSGLVDNVKHESACWWFSKMVREGIKPNGVVLSSLLSALAGLAILTKGIQVHACVVKLGLESDMFIHSSLISMYSKCGNLSEAYGIFSSISTSNLVCINSMISAFAQHGLAQEALCLFTQTLEDGHEPNKVTFLGILTVCSRAGLVEEGNYYFKSMRSVYGIEPGPDHYTCMVDLLGRAGLLHEALELISSIPNAPHPAVWGAILSASGMHSNSDFAKLAAEQLFDLEPNNATPYAVLSNIYANAGLKEDAKIVAMKKQSAGVKKNPGYSWITMDGVAINAKGPLLMCQ